jgi:hypothetical protein
MKYKFGIFLLLGCLFLSACGVYENVKNMTDSANVLLRDASEVLRLIDEKVESGELSEELGDLIDGRIETLMNELTAAIEENGGFLFDRANGTINHVFANISLLLDQINQEILAGSIPEVINQLSAQLQAETVLIGSQLEELITITFGNIFVFVDKTVNGIVIIASIILLCIGLLIFGVILLKRKRPGAFGLALVGIYVLFFLAIILIPALRGYIIVGFNLAEKVEARELQPRVSAVVPEMFRLGKTPRIIIYGNHLNLIDPLQVSLYRGDNLTFSFPSTAIAAITRNRIILGNFEQSLGWTVPPYEDFYGNVVPADQRMRFLAQYTTLAYSINDALYPNRVRRALTTVALTPHRLAAVRARVPGLPSGTPQPREERAVEEFPPSVEPLVRFSVARATSFPSIKLKSNETHELLLELARGIFATTSAATQMVSNIEDVFSDHFNLQSGDYGLRVYQDESLVESSQFLSMVYPPPPPPKPDIEPLSLTWTDGVPAIKGREARLTVRLGFAHPEQIRNEFRVQITSSPAIAISPITVSSFGRSGNFADFTTRSFSPPQEGNYRFTVRVDDQGQVAEHNEANNTLTQDLTVKREVYDVTLSFLTFQSKESLDSDEDEYRLDVSVNVTGYTKWSFQVNRDGEPGDVFDLTQSRAFRDLSPGATITISSGAREKDWGFRDGDDPMGSRNWAWTLDDNPTNGQDSKEFSRTLSAPKYFLTFKLRILRRLI